MPSLDDLRRLAITTGEIIQEAKRGLERAGRDNAAWAAELKTRIRAAIRAGLGGVRVVETPWRSRGIRRGEGANELVCEGDGAVTVLADVVDGTWNAASNVPWSASTMLAFTTSDKPAEALELADFTCSLIAPMHGRGFYVGAAGEVPVFRDGGVELPLHASDVTNPCQARFFLDLYTELTYDGLSRAIDAVKPLIHAWADIGRFYGAGIELMSLLAPPNTTPGFAGYVAASQKADNLIPTTMLLEGAGVIVTSWRGESIARMKLLDRMDVAIAATRPLHAHMIGHLAEAR